jgi:hypothetical protein
MRRFTLFLFLITIFAPIGAHAYSVDNGLVEVEVVDDYGRAYATFPARSRASRDDTRAYLEAVPGRSYAIRVTNGSGERVGLVIAVDGRNIISGKKSKLKRGERMYVLGPWESATYRGWRTGSDRVNEFFFTSELDSYAGAFGDFSAMGVVAVAVFRDRQAAPTRYRKSDPRAEHRDYDGAASPGAHSGRLESRKSAPGTGFGDERYAPSYRVRFNAERRPAARTFIKYEWRETLCEMGVVRCHSRKNRFWPQSEVGHRARGFAPYPPGYRLRPGRSHKSSWRGR